MLALLVGITAWCVIEFLVTRHWLAIFWDKRWRGTLTRANVAKILLSVARFLPLVTGVLLMLLMPGAGISKLIPRPQMLMALGYFVLLDAAVSWYRVRTERAAALDSCRQHRVRVWLFHTVAPIATLAFSTVLVMRGSVLGTMGMLLGFFVIGLGMAYATGQGGGASAFEMDDSPLKAEVTHIGDRFLSRNTRYFVHVQKKRPSGFMTPVTRMQRQRTARQPTVDFAFPLANFLEVNPGAFTAALCCHFARWARPGSFMLKLWFIPLGIYIGLGIVLFMILVFFFVLAFSSLQAASRGMGRTEALLGLAAGSVAYIWVGRALGLFRTRYDTLHDGYRVWCEVRNNETRDVAGFVEALKEYRAHQLKIHDPELLDHMFKIDPALQKFLCRQSETPATKPEDTSQQM